jgi:hypothetical protein
MIELKKLSLIFHGTMMYDTILCTYDTLPPPPKTVARGIQWYKDRSKEI